MPALAPAPTDRMHCMEVWGGNSHVDRGLTTPGLQVWVYSQPHENATNGGDVYYVSSCASGRITRLLLADVSGHGQAVAAISAELRDLMRRNVNLINQSQFVSEMNQQFADNSGSDEFATALVCTFFSPTRSLQFCNAGHPIPFLYRVRHNEWVLASAAANVELASGIADTPLGAIDEAEYSRFEIKLEPGDMVMCVSDAFTESFDSNGQMLGMDGLLSLVQELDVSRPEALVRELTERITREQNDNLNKDDATVLVFRADGSSPSLMSDLFAPIRLLRGVRDATDFDRVDDATI
jgi:sigma-B regulation protein RsbU (phosphoserine phosphatase)